MLTEIFQHKRALYTINYENIALIHTTVTAYSTDVDAWIAEIRYLHASHLSSLVVGLDLEWRPNRSHLSENNHIALLQLCVGNSCLIFQLYYCDLIPWSLVQFLADPLFTFVGVGIHGDVRKLFDEFHLVVQNPVDLMILHVQKRRFAAQRGLAGLAAVMGLPMDKKLDITLSDWQEPYLTTDQVTYACLDAFVSFEIGRRLLTCHWP